MCAGNHAAFFLYGGIHVYVCVCMCLWGVFHCSVLDVYSCKMRHKRHYSILPFSPVIRAYSVLVMLLLTYLSLQASSEMVMVIYFQF